MKNVIAISAAFIGLSIAAPAVAQSIIPGSEFYETRNEEAQRQVTADGGVAAATTQTDARAYGYAQGNTTAATNDTSVVPGSDFYRTEANEAERGATQR